MEQKQRFGGLDRFKFIAAFLVVAIHTSPLSSFSANADFLLTRVLARTAVPFFLMVTGYFLLPQYLFEKSMDRRPLLRFLKKTVLLYGIAILLYLPVNIYAGHFQGAGIGELIRKVLFDFLSSLVSSGCLIRSTAGLLGGVPAAFPHIGRKLPALVPDWLIWG